MSDNNSWTPEQVAVAAVAYLRRIFEEEDAERWTPNGTLAVEIREWLEEVSAPSLLLRAAPQGGRAPGFPVPTAQGVTGIYGHHALVLDVEEGSVKTYFNGELIVNVPLPQPRWIPVDERLPETEGDYLVLVPNPEGKLVASVAFVVPGDEPAVWIVYRGEDQDGPPTHWMPIPPLAEEPRPYSPLSAAGVEISKERREHILELVRSDRLVEAQKLILDWLLAEEP